MNEQTETDLLSETLAQLIPRDQRDSWAIRLSVSRASLDHWCDPATTTGTPPSSISLYFFYQMAKDTPDISDPQGSRYQAWMTFLHLLDRPAYQVTRWDRQMRPTVGQYMLRHLSRRFQSTLHRHPTPEVEQTLIQLIRKYANPESTMHFTDRLEAAKAKAYTQRAQEAEAAKAKAAAKAEEEEERIAAAVPGAIAWLHENIDAIVTYTITTSNKNEAVLDAHGPRPWKDLPYPREAIVRAAEQLDGITVWIEEVKSGDYKGMTSVHLSWDPPGR